MDATEEPPVDGVEADADEDRQPAPTVSALRTSPDRTVFTEESNVDGWIATDLTVDAER
jgi:hypothetical protein